MNNQLTIDRIAKRDRLNTPRLRSLFRAFIVTMRPYLMTVSGITGLAGLSFAPTGSPFRAAAVLLASWLSYGFGQALTDCFQTDTDAISSPYRPLTHGGIGKRAVFFTSIAGLTLCSILFSLATPLNLLLGLCAVAGLLTYTWFKRRWWAGPMYNAAIVVVLFLMSVVGMGGRLNGEATACVLTAGAVFFGYAHFVLMGYFKDVEADRRTGYDTLPVRHGRVLAIRITDLLAALTVAFVFAALAILAPRAGTLISGSVAGVCFLFGSWSLAVSQRTIRLFPGDDKAYRAIIPGLYGYVLLLSSVAIMNHLWAAVPAGATLIFFEKSLGHRPERSQI